MAKATKTTVPPVKPKHTVLLTLDMDEALAILVLTGETVTGDKPIGLASARVYNALNKVQGLKDTGGYLEGNPKFLK